MSGAPHAAGLGVQPKIVKKTSTDALEAKIDLLKTLLEAGDLTQEAFEKRQSELQDAMTDVEKVEAAQEVVAQTDGEPKQKDGKEVKRKRKTFTEVAKFATKNEAVNWLQQEDRCKERLLQLELQVLLLELLLGQQQGLEGMEEQQQRRRGAGGSWRDVPWLSC